MSLSFGGTLIKMTDNYCVLCNWKKLSISRDEQGFSQIIDPNTEPPNGVIRMYCNTSYVFSICENPECHERLADYLYNNHINKHSRFIELTYKDKTYYFPIDKRIINSLPGKIAEMKKETYKHQFGNMRLK